MKISRDSWVLIVLFIVLLIGGVMLATPKRTSESKVSTTYNPDRMGVKAFYTLMSNLGYTNDRLLQPYNKIPENTKVLVVVQPHISNESIFFTEKFRVISKKERNALKDWVRGGGVVMFFSDDLKGVPAAFGSTRELGKGMVYAFNSRKGITNWGLRNGKNAVKTLEIISKHAGKRDLVLFDEYHHGFKASESSMPMGRQAKIALVMLAVAGLILCYARGRRFGAVRNLPVTDTLRPGFEFVESVGRLYQRADAADTAAEILCKSFKNNLCMKLGLSVDASGCEIMSRLESGTDEAIIKRVGEVIANCESSQAGQKPSESELLHIAREIQKLEQELRLGSVNA